MADAGDWPQLAELAEDVGEQLDVDAHAGYLNRQRPTFWLSQDDLLFFPMSSTLRRHRPVDGMQAQALKSDRGHPARRRESME
jgi:hypothetical protein